MTPNERQTGTVAGIISETEEHTQVFFLQPETLQREGTVPRSCLRKHVSKDQLKRKINYSKEPNWYKRLLVRLREDSQFVRSIVQFTFLLLCGWIGIEFYLFMKWGQSGGQELFYQRPPGVEGFLPISALISLKYWIQTGILNNIHPSGLIILLAVVAISLLMKKAFCGWLCPVGTISESLWMLGKKIFGGNLSFPKWIDYPLRSLKYFLAFFFVYSILQMNEQTLKGFIYSPYNKVADIKMYLFFAHLSSWTFGTLLSLSVLSLGIKNFWCRYLCPYGSFLGILSWLSPLKITRRAATCIDCELCTKACPSSINVHTATRVWSDECMSCYACVDACPVKNTLLMSVHKKSPAVPTWIFGILLTGIFIGITGLAMLTGMWQNGISKEEYLRRIQNIESPLYQHNRGQVPAYGPQD
jgi:Pyruvate/2-oxoacid:ferredoxin oxidoreductase delta subunit